MSGTNSPLTVYEEYGLWGYSRVFATPEHLELRHYAARIATNGMDVELPFTVTDRVTLPRRGGRA